MRDSLVNPKKKAVLVLGMHRSGTSLLAAGLESLGIALGSVEASNLSQDNPKGYFENAKILKFNNDLLKTLRSKWDDPLFHYHRASSLIDPEKLSSLKDAAQQLLEEEFSNAKTFGIKDPRICLLLPFWLEVLETFLDGRDHIHLIFIVRNPLEVAKSQHKRHQNKIAHPNSIGKNLDETISLWFTSYLTALNHFQGLHNICIGHKNLVTDGTRTLKQITDYLNLPGAEQKIETFAKEFIKSSLHREKSDADDLETLRKRTPYIVKMYEFLDEKSEGKSISGEEANAFLSEFDDINQILKIYQPLSPLYSELFYETEEHPHLIKKLKDYKFLHLLKTVQKLRDFFRRS
jgi:hypothetical protein